MAGKKRKGGRPATGHDPVTAVRLSAELKAMIDRWCSTQPDRPLRSEAIRRLLLIGLAAPKRGRPEY
jgi:hypothetical protein